ncbi:FAD-binding oxidoreductase [Magnetospirillum fulvum]|uniref:4-phosphoerythronate dehydrogenase (FAD-dependent) n=1 Tax=Magnetospirillum fulvum TaxID=1082 RepID=A0A1H6HVX7_MAGFU|nr:FAD-binding oxidoreductase [Magnetospirillum fulvum]SEH38341.1 4-phosphoerythronate dehydrogenase (FAD-dependent) [Magnetospirillum fulvum]
MRELDHLAAIVGPGNLVTDPDDMAPYLVEERGLYRGTALAVARPGSTAEVAALVTACAEAGIAMVPQGGRTGLCGGAVPAGLERAIVIATERMDRIRAVDPVDFTMTVEAGCILATIQAAADEVGCLFPLSLAAEGSCRIGGNIATNAGGTNVLRYGSTRDLVLGLEVVLPDGRVWNGIKALRKDNTGYALNQLFIGSEGTLGIVTAAVLKLYPRPAEHQTALIGLPDPQAALALLGRARRASGDAVTACELMSRFAFDLAVRHIPGLRDPLQTASPWLLLLELSSSRPGGLREAVETVLEEALEDGTAQDAVLAESETQRLALWRLRESIPEAQKHEGGSIKHDISVATSHVPDLIGRATAAVAEALPGARPVAFGHIGDGNIHFNVSQPVGADKDSFLDQWPRLNRIIHDVVTAMGGSISAEHGIGRLKAAELVRIKPDVDLDLMHRIKQAFDPDGLMNPGAVLIPR